MTELNLKTATKEEMEQRINALTKKLMLERSESLYRRELCARANEYLGELLDMLAEIYKDDGDKAEEFLKYVDFQKELSTHITPDSIS